MAIHKPRTSLVAQMVKRLPTMWETWVWSVGWENPLEKEMATHSSILAWKIPWMEEHGRLQSMGWQRVRYNWATSLTHTYIFRFIYSTIKNTMWKSKCYLLSCVWLLSTPWTAAYHAPPSMGFSRQEYWSGFPLPGLSRWALNPMISILIEVRQRQML